MAVKENQPQNTKSSRLLTRQDAAAYCSISVTTFDSICPIIPFALVKGRTRLCRFDKHDIDLWIEDSSENRHRCELALVDLNAEWGETTETWGPVSQLPSGWLERQAVFCLTSPHAAVDIMRFVEGMSDWQLSRMNCSPEKTKLGTPYFGLSDNDMLQCQLALIENQRNAERVRYLQNILKP